MTATHDKYMFLAVFIIEQTGNKLTVRRNRLAANRTNALYPRFSNWIAMGTSIYMAKLIRNSHWTIYLAYKIFSR